MLKGWDKNSMKIKNNDRGVSQIVATILLLAIAITLFSTLWLFTSQTFFQGPDKQMPSVEIAGRLEESSIYLEHTGGTQLPLGTEILVKVGNENHKRYKVEELLENQSEWDFGTTLELKNLDNITDDVKVQVYVIDSKNNEILMTGILQEGKTFEKDEPYVLTLKSVSEITYKSCKIGMKYNFKDFEGYVRFFYTTDPSLPEHSWKKTSISPKLDGTGEYYNNLDNLDPDTKYYFRAVLSHNSTETKGDIESFKTLGWSVGRWHFNEATGTNVEDTSGYENDGTIINNAEHFSNGLNGTYCLKFDGIDDYVHVPDDESLDVTEEITIEQWINPLNTNSGFAGEITDSIIDSSNFGISRVYDPFFMKLKNNTYAVVFRDQHDHGYLTTVDITEKGNISIDVLDFFEFENSNCILPSMTIVDDKIYAIAFRGDNDDGFIKTVKIKDNGVIEKTVIDSYNFASSCQYPQIFRVNGTTYFGVAYQGIHDSGVVETIEIYNSGVIHGSIHQMVFDLAAIGSTDEFDTININGSVYAVVYNGADNDGFITTMEIPSTGMVAAISTTKFDTSRCHDPDIVHVKGDYYAVAYEGFNESGFVRTLKINKDGSIGVFSLGEAVVPFKDSLIFEYAGGFEPSIKKLVDNKYGIAYRGPGNDGFLKTLEIRDDGEISDSVLSTLEFDTDNSYQPSLLRINENTCTISYRGYYGDGIIRSLDVLSSGEIGSIIDSQEFDVFDCLDADVIKIDSDIYALVYRGLDNDGYLRTIQIQSDGSISDDVIDAIEFDRVNCYSPEIKLVKKDVGQNVFAVVYSGKDYHGYVKTIQILPNGQINKVVDTLEFDTSYGRYPTITQINTNNYAIAYTGPGWDGYIKTIEIQTDGTINNIIDTLEYDNNYGREPSLLHVDKNVYLVSYMGPSYDGYVKILRIGEKGSISDQSDDYLEFENNNVYNPRLFRINQGTYGIAGGRNYHEYSGYITTIEVTLHDQTQVILSKNNAYGIYANETNIFGRINDKEISASIIDGWQHIVLRYDKSSLKLFRNGTEIASMAYSEKISERNSDLIIGGWHTIIDEVGIYAKGFSDEEINQWYMDGKST